LFVMARGLRDFRGSSSLSTWLYKVARSFCIKKRRRRSVEASLGQPNEGDTAAAAERVIDPGGTPEEALADARVERALQEAIAELEPLYRETLVLRDIEGLTAPEVAEVLGIGVRAVKSRLHRARLAVRARMVPLLETGGGAGAEATAATSAAGRGNCPDVLTLFTKHLEGEIGPEVCAAMERHLEGCDRCRGACDSFKRVLALCQTAPATPVPPDVQRSVRRALQDFLARGA